MSKTFLDEIYPAFPQFRTYAKKVFYTEELSSPEFEEEVVTSVPAEREDEGERLNTATLISCPDCQVEEAWWHNREVQGPIPLVFLVDAPDLEEFADLDQAHEYPLTNQAAQLLEKMIKAMKLEKGEYYITLVKKRAEAEGPCLEHWQEEIISLRPRVVATLGASTTKKLLGDQGRLSKIHGQFFDWRPNEEEEFLTQVIPLFHPQFLMMNPSMKRTTWEDLQGLMNFLGKA